MTSNLAEHITWCYANQCIPIRMASIAPCYVHITAWPPRVNIITKAIQTVDTQYYAVQHTSSSPFIYAHTQTLLFMHPHTVTMYVHTCIHVCAHTHAHTCTLIICTLTYSSDSVSSTGEENRCDLFSQCHRHRCCPSQDLPRV